MVEMSKKVQDLYNKVSDKVQKAGKVLKDEMTDGLNRVAITLAFLGCVNAASAKTVTGAVAGVDGTTTYLLTNEGKLKIDSPSLVAAVTKAHNQKGGDLLVRLSFDENTSMVTGGNVYHSRVRLTDGVSGAIWDIGSIADGAHEMWSNIKDVNISRILNQSADIISNYAPQPIQAGGKVRRIAVDEQGRKGWAQWHTVDRSGRLITNTNVNIYSQLTPQSQQRVSSAQRFEQNNSSSTTTYNRGYRSLYNR